MREDFEKHLKLVVWCVWYRNEKDSSFIGCHGILQLCGENKWSSFRVFSDVKLFHFLQEMLLFCFENSCHPTQQRPPHSNLSGFPRAPCGLGSAHLLRFHTNCGIQLVSVPLKMFKIQSSPSIQQNQCLIHQNELLATQWMFFFFFVCVNYSSPC